MGKYYIFIILLISLVVRIPRFDYPISDIFNWGDGTRDYLVANHILTYHEFPLTGPYNYFFDLGILNSPLYFYLLALILLPFNHILTLSFVNIILQILTLTLIYHTGKRIFNQNVAAIGTIIYSLNPEIIKYSDFIWQPNLMLPTILLSIYFLTKPKISFLNLIIAQVLFSLALTLHNTALSWLLPFFILTFLILKDMKKSLKYFFANLAVFSISLIIFYSPVIFFYLTNPDFKISLINLLITKANYLPKLITNLEQFFQIFNLNITWGLVLIILIFAFLKHKILPLSLFILPIALAPFLNKIRMHYLLLSVPFFIFLSLNLADQMFKKFKRFRIGLIILLILTFTANLQIFREFRKPLYNFNLISDITDKIYEDLERIKNAKDFQNYDFFQVSALMDDKYIFTYPVIDTLLVVPLEKKLNSKLAKLSNTSPYSHIQTNSKDYLIIPCIKIEPQTCQDEFKARNPKYHIVKVIHSGSDFPVFLAKLGIY